MNRLLKYFFTLILLVSFTIIAIIMLAYQIYFLPKEYYNNKKRLLLNFHSELKNSLLNNNLPKYYELINSPNDNNICSRIVSNNFIISPISSSYYCELDSLSAQSKRNLIEYLDNELDYNLNLKYDNTNILIAGSKIKLNDNNLYILSVSSIVNDPSQLKLITNQILILIIMIVIIIIIASYLFYHFFIKTFKKIAYDLNLVINADYPKDNNYYFKEFKDLDESLKNLSLKIKENENFKKELIENISHDLRTPLSIIQGYSEILMLKGGEAHEYASLINKESIRLGKLINYLNLCNSKLIANFKSLNIKEYLNDIYDFHYPFLKKQGIKFNLEIDAEYDLEIDLNLFNQVLYNLISNAYKHNDKEAKIIIIKAYIKDGKKYLSVIDNGTLIKEDIKTLMTRYYSEDNHRKSYNGKGIGLALIKEIIDLHNFKLSLNTTFGYNEFCIEVH